MDRVGSADLLGLGQNCSVPECQQNDFLPFKCDCCHLIFCLEHRTYQNHACSQSGSRETNTIVCPICAKAIKLSAADNPNTLFEQHTRQGCDPSNYAKVHQRPRCPAHGCREKLGAINTYTCKECSKQVCLKHRFAQDHQCAGRSGESFSLLLIQACLRRLDCGPLATSCSGSHPCTIFAEPRLQTHPRVYDTCAATSLHGIRLRVIAAICSNIGKHSWCPDESDHTGHASLLGR